MSNNKYCVIYELITTFHIWEGICDLDTQVPFIGCVMQA